MATIRIDVCPNPVFIIGSPRSGTTALANALGRHPVLWVSKESYFIYQLFGRATSVWRQSQRRATPCWLKEEGVDRDEFLASLGVGVNALYTSRSGGRRWIDQTPLYTKFVDELAVMFPGAQFLHIVRDGRAVVRSMSNFFGVFDAEQRQAVAKDVPAWVDDFSTACTTWAEWVGTALRFAGEHPERCLTIGNERLATDPAGGFARIFAFLGVDDDGASAQAFSGTRVNSSFRADPASGHSDDWSAQQWRTFAEIAGDTMRLAGYADDAELTTWAQRGEPVAS